MTKHEQAAKMRAEGKSIEEIMAWFGLDRKSTYYLISRGKLLTLRAEYKPRPTSRLANREYVRERNRRVVAMVKAGATYSEAAAAQCITREAVAGICHRAGVKAPVTPQKIERVNNRMSKATAKRWNNLHTQFPPRI